MKLIELKIKRFIELITGILLANGTHWSLIRLNVVDYVLDGFQFTNKKYIVYEKEIEESSMSYKILRIKNENENMLPSIDNCVLNEINELYSYLKRKDLMVAICLHREDILYIGKIKDVGKKSFVLDSYDTELCRSGLIRVEYTKVRYIQLHTDYLDSLCLLINSPKI